MRGRSGTRATVASRSGEAVVSSGVGGTYSTPKGALVNIEGDYYGATPEAVADEFDKKARRANLVSQISKVGK